MQRYLFSRVGPIRPVTYQVNHIKDNGSHREKRATSFLLQMMSIAVQRNVPPAGRELAEIFFINLKIDNIRLLTDNNYF